MQNFIITLLICSVTMSVLGIFYMAVTPLLAERYSPKGQYYAWLIIIIGLIIPFRPRFKNPFVKIISTDTTMPAIQLGSGTQLTSPIAPTAASLPAPASPAMPLTWWQAAAAIWVTGMVIYLIYHMVKHFRFLKMTKRWSDPVTDAEVLRLFQDIRKEAGISGKIGLYQCECAGTPMLTGFIHPRILLPHIHFAADELRFILYHELVHYKRKDLWYKSLILLATAVHWSNPLVYLIAKAINIQCEISCDSEVVDRTDADTRLHYSETIIGVVRYQSNLKTALATNFYGGKKGMKKRIFSIMDTRSKKTGIAVLCGVLLLTFGTGFASAANEDADNAPKAIYTQESFSYGYRFQPTPEIYGKYFSMGLSISEDGKKLLYNGQKVKLFVDEYADGQAFYYDEEGTVNLRAAYNSSGKITGLSTLAEEEAKKIRAAFFQDDIKSEINSDNSDDDVNSESAPKESKFDSYAPFGITLNADKNIMYFNGQRVRLFVDKNESENYYYTAWQDKEGTVDLSVLRDSSGQIKYIVTLSKEAAQYYVKDIESAGMLSEDELNALEDKITQRVTEKMNEKYPQK